MGVGVDCEDWAVQEGACPRARQGSVEAWGFRILWVPERCCTLPASTIRAITLHSSAVLPVLQVAEVCVAALYEGGATDKVVEIIAEKDAARKDWGELFEGVEM